MKYHMKPLGMTKAQDFHQNLYDLLLHSQDITRAFRWYDIKLKGVLKSQHIFTKTS